MKNIVKRLVILRGLPGAGKSTLAQMIADEIFEADQFFYDEDDVYQFDFDRLEEAHADCFARFQIAVDRECSSIAVSNTSSLEWEFEKYRKYAQEHGYLVFSLIVENRHGGESIHDVPPDAMEDIRERFEVQLKPISGMERYEDLYSCSRG